MSSGSNRWIIDQWCTMAFGNSRRNNSAVYQLVKEDQRDVGVLDLPTDSGSTMKASKYLYYQTYHSKPIPYAPDVRASTSSLLRNNALKHCKICRRRSDEQKALGFGGPQRGSQSLITLRDAKIGWIVLHKDIDPSVFAKLSQPLKKNLERDCCFRKYHMEIGFARLMSI